MNSLAIISSPLQLLNFKEYIIHNQINEYNIIVISYIKREEKQILNTAKILELDISKIINGNRFLQYFKLNRFCRSNLNYKRLVIGNFFSDPHLFCYHKMQIDNLTVLDDGINTSLIKNYYNKNIRIIKSGLFKRLALLHFFKVKLTYPIEFEFFTFMKTTINNQLIRQSFNNFTYIKSRIKNFKEDHQSYLIGQPFVELNIMSKDLYVKYLTKICNKHKNIVYIPSRKENDQNLEYIQKNLNLKIQRTSSNIEVFFIINKLIPKNILGFTSSALITLKNIFYSSDINMNIKSFKVSFDGNRFSDDVFSNYYNIIEDSGIKIYNL
jgi:hypothetical protein